MASSQRKGGGRQTVRQAVRRANGQAGKQTSKQSDSKSAIRTSSKSVGPRSAAAPKPERLVRPPRRSSGAPSLKRGVVERLVRYTHFLRERDLLDSGATVSSGQIAEYIGVDESQVRKDIASLGVRGYPRVGFRTGEVLERISEVLGFGKPYAAVVVGAGHLGAALANYEGFGKYGLHIAAVLDVDPALIGTQVGPVKVRPVSRLESEVARAGAQLAILAIPAGQAQSVADRLVAAGVRAIWNFAPTRVLAPAGIMVRNEHISVGLGEISYTLKKQAERGRT